MKAKDTTAPQEPVGIVISGTPAPPKSTVFSAYVWSVPAESGGSERKPT